MDSWMSDRDLSAYLTRNGIAVSTERASLWFDSGAMEPEEMDAFAKLVNRGIIDIEAYLGVSRAGGRRIRYFISNRVEISHSTWHSIFLPLAKVQNRTAPYLHETVHQLAPCDDCPMWFNEGLASFVQSYVSEHAGGYDGAIFSDGRQPRHRSGRQAMARFRPWPGSAAVHRSAGRTAGYQLRPFQCCGAVLRHGAVVGEIHRGTRQTK